MVDSVLASQQLLREAIHSLPDGMRCALVLHGYLGLSGQSDYQDPEPGPPYFQGPGIESPAESARLFQRRKTIT